MTPPDFANGPLTGIKILDCSAVVAGPWASSQLADMGAEVIWIERADGADVMRLTGPVKDDQSGCWVSMHRNKRGMAMNLRDERAIDVVKRLAVESDIFIQNFRPGVADRLGIGYESLAALNPELIYVSISGFGPTGPYSDQPVYDPIVQGLSGMASAQGGDFVKSIVADKTTAMTATNAALGALIARMKGAGGQHVELSLLESLMAWMWPDVYWNEAFPDREKDIPNYSVWYAPYKTSDGQISAVWASFEQFQAAARAVGRPDVAEDERFATRAGRLEHSLVMRESFAEAIGSMTTEQAVASLREADVPCAPCLNREDVMVDPQVAHMKILIEEEHPTAGRTITVRPPARFSATPTSIRTPSPGRSEHTDEVLAGLGMDQETIDQFRSDGVTL